MGFDTNDFKNKPDEEYLCCLCHDVFESPRQCPSCNNSFCKKCITTWLTNGDNKCPMCRKPLTLNSLASPSREFIRLLGKLEIKCNFHKFGCKEWVKIDQLEDHRKRCPFDPTSRMECKSCGANFHKDQVQNHSCLLFLKSKVNEKENVIKGIVREMNQMRESIVYKIVLVGDSGVGKTSLLASYIDQTFTNIQSATVGIDFKVKTLEINRKNVTLQIWDLPGQDRYQAIGPLTFRKAQGVALIYSVGSRKSFDNIKKWMDIIESHAPEDINKVLIGNRCDEPEVVNSRMGEKLARKLNVPFFLTSAKMNTNVVDAFGKLAHDIMNRLESRPSQELVSYRRKIHLKQPEKPTKSACSC